MRPVTSHAELLEGSRQDPWVRWSLPGQLAGEIWTDGRVLLVQRLGWRPGFWVSQLTTPLTSEEVRVGLLWLRDGGHLQRTGARSVSVPQGHLSVAQEVLSLGEGGDWEWMWTSTAPPLDPREELVVELDDVGDAAQIEHFSRTNNPRVWTEIGTGKVKRWLGLRDLRGRLIAVGGAEAEASGTPHLAGIVTASDRRREGLGSVISAALTRAAIEDHGACTLGMFSDNDVARRVYHRLGYQTARAWSSRVLITADQDSSGGIAHDRSKTRRPPT